MSEKFISCSQCGCQVSTPVPPGTQIRAWVQCHKCVESNCQITAIVQLIRTIRQAAANYDWCDEDLADAIVFAEKCLPTRLK
jgi:hypothetical protein